MNNSPTLKNFCLYFLKLGATGFGGPATLVHLIEKNLVEEKKWVTKDEFIQGFSLSQLTPGPIASQIVMYLGWKKFRVKGATLCGLSFITVPFLICIFLGFFYKRYEHTPLLPYLSHFLAPCLMGIIFSSIFNLQKKFINHQFFLFFLSLFIFLLGLSSHFSTIFLLLMGGITVLTVEQFSFLKTKFFIFPITFLSFQTNNLLVKPLTIFSLFFKSGALIFGSGLTIIPYLQTHLVEQLHLITQQQFLDALSVGMLTPGPVIIIVTFLGYIMAGFGGAIAATLGIFFPCYLLTLLFAPGLSKWANHPYLKSFMTGITISALALTFSSTVNLFMPEFTNTWRVLLAILCFSLLLAKKTTGAKLVLLFLAVGILKFYLYP